MSPPVMAGLVSVCSWNFSDSSRRPLRADDADRSRSNEDGGDGTMSSSRTMRRSRLSAGTLRAAAGALRAAALRAEALGAALLRAAGLAVRFRAFRRPAAFRACAAVTLRARGRFGAAFRRAGLADALRRAWRAGALRRRARPADALRGRVFLRPVARAALRLAIAQSFLPTLTVCR